MLREAITPAISNVVKPIRDDGSETSPVQLEPTTDNSTDLHLSPPAASPPFTALANNFIETNLSSCSGATQVRFQLIHLIPQQSKLLP